MRLISLHVDTVRALERLRVPFDDLTPDGLWSSAYHLVGLTSDQCAVLAGWNLEVPDLTPATLSDAAEPAPQPGEPRRATPQGSEEALETQATHDTQDIHETQDIQETQDIHEIQDIHETQATLDTQDIHETQATLDPPDARHALTTNTQQFKRDDSLASAAEREIVSQAAAAAEAAAASASRHNVQHPDGTQTNAHAAAGLPSHTATEVHREPTKLRVSVGGKYREAAVQEGKILLDGESYDSPAQAAKAVPGAKGNWVFWEYYDADAGKWRILDSDWQPGPTT